MNKVKSIKLIESEQTNSLSKIKTNWFTRINQNDLTHFKESE